MIPTQNHAIVAARRAEKAALLALMAVHRGIPSDRLEALDWVGWCSLAALADVAAPSHETRAATVRYLRHMERAADHAAAAIDAALAEIS